MVNNSVGCLFFGYLALILFCTMIDIRVRPTFFCFNKSELADISIQFLLTNN